MPMFYSNNGIIYLVLIIASALSFYAQFKVKNTFTKYSNVKNRNGFTGEQVATQLLLLSGVNDVRVLHIAGTLTDHYDPTNKVIRLSDAVFQNQSISALSVAAHETGHALQHNKGYLPLGIRSAIFPVVNIGSKMATPLIMIGFLLATFSGVLGMFMINIGIILFAIVVFFNIVTLPVEFDASKRALEMLEDNSFLTADEIVPAKKVLSAAALTYVAAAILAILNLVQLIIAANNRRR